MVAHGKDAGNPEAIHSLRRVPGVCLATCCSHLPERTRRFWPTQGRDKPAAKDADNCWRSSGYLIEPTSARYHPEAERLRVHRWPGLKVLDEPTAGWTSCQKRIVTLPGRAHEAGLTTTTHHMTGLALHRGDHLSQGPGRRVRRLQRAFGKGYAISPAPTR